MTAKTKSSVVLILVLALVAVMTPASASTVRDDLRDLRRAMARFQHVEAALDAGYELGYVNGDGVRIITGCIAE